MATKDTLLESPAIKKKNKSTKRVTEKKSAVPVKDLAYYMSLPYSYEFIQEEDGTWFAAVRELPGCMSAGDDILEAYAMIRDAQTGWIELGLEDGEDIPEPYTTRKNSRRITSVTPDALYWRAFKAAREEGITVEEFVNIALEKALAS